MRYAIMNCSKSAHCCFTHTVIDRTKPEILGGKHYEDENGKHYETICECFSLEDAELVANALNNAI